MTRLLLALIVSALVATPARGQNPASSSPDASATLLRVQVTLSRFEGEKRLASMPYSLLVDAGQPNERVTLRMGVPVPITSVGKDGPVTTMYDIGTNMDCSATAVGDGRFRLVLAVNHSSVYESDQHRLTATQPRANDSTQLVRSFTTRFTLVLRDGQSLQSIAATDSVTGEVMKIDVQLAVLK